MASKPGGLNITECLQPRKGSPVEKSLGGEVVGKPIQSRFGEGRCFLGKKRARAPRKPTVVRDQTPRERTVEITPGRSKTQQGLTATCKDPSNKEDRIRRESFGLTRESVGAMKEE
jgi:hypothetical protein